MMELALHNNELLKMATCNLEPNMYKVWCDVAKQWTWLILLQ